MKLKSIIKYTAIFFSVFFISLPSVFTIKTTETSNWEANSVAVDSLGDVIVTGYIDDEGTLKFYTVKHSEEDGSILWKQKFGEYTYNDAKGVAVDSQDNVIVAGAVNSTGLLQGYDYCLVKYDTAGNELWHRKYNRKMYDTPLAVAVDSMDNIIVTGMAGRITFIPQLTIDLDFWTIKCDSNGNKLYENVYDVSELDTSFGVAIDSQDNVIIAGMANYSSNLSYYTIKYSSTLSKIWEKSFSSGIEDAGSAVAVDSEDNIIVTGGSSDGSSLNYSTIKYTPDGVLLSSWPQFYDSPNGGKDDARGVAIDLDDNIVVAGGSDGEWYIIKYDPDGAVIWEQMPDILGEARDVAVDESNNIIVTGYREVKSIKNFYTLKFNANGIILWGRVVSSADMVPPKIKDVNVSVPIIPEDTNNECQICPDTASFGEATNISVEITDASEIVSVTIDLTSLLGWSPTPLTNIPGTDTWYILVNAPEGTAIHGGTSYLPHVLVVTASDEYGNWNTTTVNMTVWQNGDVNGDGTVNLYDATYLAKWYFNQPGFEYVPLNVADVSGDCQVTLYDATYLAKWYFNQPGFEVRK